MHKRLVTLLILLMVALPVWSASVTCCHLQKAQHARVMESHACCEHTKANMGQHGHHASSADQSAKTGQCSCDKVQHSQFILSLPTVPMPQPVARFGPESRVPTLPPERQETIIRPPIT